MVDNLLSVSQDLFISEYVEGSSFNKAIEIYNGTGTAVNLSDYTLRTYFNGSTSAGSTLALTGTIANNDVFVLAHPSANSAVLAVADVTNSGVINFNGDDAIVLSKNSNVVDAFGQIGVDPGTSWPGGGANVTLRRKSSITDGDTNANDPFDASVEWDSFTQDTFDGLGSHTVDQGGDSPTISISATDAIKAEGNSGTTNFTFTVTRTNFTAPSSINYAVSSSQANSEDFVGGVFPSGIVNFGNGETSQVISIPVSGDTDSEPDEDFTVTLSNPPANVSLLTNTAEGTIQNDDFANTFISNIQGTGSASPILGQTVTIEAIVTGDFQNGTFGTDGDLDGFFLQEEDTDVDLDPLTSEGIFVFDGSSPTVNVTVGDMVQVTGTVTEFFGLTQLTNVTVNVVGTDNLPTPATVNFPVNTVESLEAYEAMQITIPDTLYVTEYFNLNRFGEIVLSANAASNETGTDGRLDQYTDFNAPNVTGNSNYLAEIDKRRILLDDGQDIQNPDPIIHGRGGNPLSATNTVRGGDTVNDLSGILSYGFDEYRIQPTAPVDFQPTNARSATPEDVGGTLKVASLNVLNFFTTLGDSGLGSGPSNLEPRGASNQTEFNRQLEKLVTTLATMDADVVGLLEVENEYDDLNGDGKIAIETIVNALNQRVGAGTYAYVDPGTPFGDTGDAITVATIYKTTAVKIADGTTVEFLTDADLPSIGLSGPIFDGDNTSRAPMAVTFEQLSDGGTFTFSVNHFKSKGGTGTGDNADIGDGQGNFNGTRVRAAQAVNTWLTSDPTGSGDQDFMIVGDLNSYAQEDPITTLESAGYTNLLEQFVGNEAYSYVFDGQFGYLDYALANNNLLSQVTGATEWHINSDEPSAFDYNLDFGRNPNLFDGQTPYRTSDHDPVIVGLNLTPPLNEITGTNGNDNNLVGTNGNDLITGLRGRDNISGAGGSDIFKYTSLQDAIDNILDFEVLIDRIDLSEVLDSFGYMGSNPIGDSYVQFAAIGNDSIIQIDPDGTGLGRARSLVRLQNVSPAQLNNSNNFIF